jgi:hypothetical protein
MSVRCLECGKVKKKKYCIQIAFHPVVAAMLTKIKQPPWICKRCNSKEQLIDEEALNDNCKNCGHDEDEHYGYWSETGDFVACGICEKRCKSQQRNDQEEV